MKLGLYIFAGLILTALVGIFAYTLNPAYIAIEIMGFNFNYPFAVWVILPMLMLFFFSAGHMMFYGYKNYKQVKNWQCDTQTLEDALFASLINEPDNKSYKVDALGSPAILLNKSKIDITDNVEGLTPRLAKVVNVIQKIKNGEYVDLKEEKLSNVFKTGNPILIQNRLNCLENDEKFVEEVLKNSENFSKPVQEKALSIFATKTNFEEAKTYINIFDIKNFLIM